MPSNLPRPGFYRISYVFLRDQAAESDVEVTDDAMIEIERRAAVDSIPEREALHLSLVWAVQQRLEDLAKAGREIRAQCLREELAALTSTSVALELAPKTTGATAEAAFIDALAAADDGEVDR